VEAAILPASEFQSQPKDGKKPLDVKDKIIVVTGAASGIGVALVKRFYAAGAKHIVSVDINLEGAQATAAEFGGTAMQADVSKEEDIKAVIDKTEAEIGPIDLFCSNAGIGAGRDLASSNDEWTLSWDVNVMSHVYAARHLAPLMVERGSGYFLNTASAAGLLNQIGSVAYGVTKHAAVGFGEWLALTYKHQGIGVSILCPQAVRTAMTANASASTQAAATDGMMEPDELAEAVMEGLANNAFCILPHKEVLGYMRRKTDDYDRWIGGMNKLHRSLTGE
jgi:NAD(P)-dependent dehydrogenase (short-subunit alcohol dehydrogenase family)